MSNNYDLAIIHVKDGKVNLTKKAEAGQIGNEIVYSFESKQDLIDFIEQLKSAGREAFKAKIG